MLKRNKNLLRQNKTSRKYQVRTKINSTEHGKINSAINFADHFFKIYQLFSIYEKNTTNNTFVYCHTS